MISLWGRQGSDQEGHDKKFTLEGFRAFRTGFVFWRYQCGHSVTTGRWRPLEAEILMA